jgi:hypothetical protein
MPGYKAHLTAGLVTFLVIGHWGPTMLHFSHLSVQTTFTALLLTLFGSIFPDIDTKSVAQLLFYKIILIISVICVAYQQFEYLILIGPLSILPVITHHRTLTHRPLFFCTLALFCTLLFGLITQKTFFAGLPGCLYFCAGALSHILLDFRKRTFFR